MSNRPLKEILNELYTLTTEIDCHDFAERFIEDRLETLDCDDIERVEAIFKLLGELKEQMDTDPDFDDASVKVGLGDVMRSALSPKATGEARNKGANQ